MLPDIKEIDPPANPEIDALYDLYNIWKLDPTPSPLHLKPNRKSFTQLSPTLFGTYNEKAWLNRLHLIMIMEEDIELGIEPGFSNYELVSLQLMIRFLSHHLNQPVTLATNPIREYTPEEKNKIIKETHDDLKHLGENKTIATIKQEHTWTNLETDVQNYIKHCDTCQRNKLTRIRPREEAVITDTPSNPNDKIAMDIVGPLPLTENGNQFILSIQDYLTKYLMLIPLQNQKPESIIDKLISHYIYIFSSPKHILTDQGQNFVSKLMEQFEKNF